MSPQHEPTVFTVVFAPDRHSSLGNPAVAVSLGQNQYRPCFMPSTTYHIVSNILLDIRAANPSHSSETIQPDIRESSAQGGRVLLLLLPPHELHRVGTRRSLLLPGFSCVLRECLGIVSVLKPTKPENPEISNIRSPNSPATVLSPKAHSLQVLSLKHTHHRAPTSLKGPYAIQWLLALNPNAS